MAASDNPEELFLRLYLDRHIKPQLAADLRSRGYAVLTTQEAGMDTASDEEQLLFASNDNRAILTFNIRDFPPCTSNGRQWAAPTPASSFPGS